MEENDLVHLEITNSTCSRLHLNQHLNSYNSLLWIYSIKKGKVWENQNIKFIPLKEAFMSPHPVKKNSIKRFWFYPVMEKTQIKKFIPEKAKLLQLCLEVCLLDALDCHCETSTYKWKDKKKSLHASVRISCVTVLHVNCHIWMFQG